MDKDVAPDLGDRGRDQGRIGAREAEPRGERAALRARDHDVGLASDRYRNFIGHRGRFQS